MIFTRPDPKPAKREKKARRPLQRKTRLRARGRTAHARRRREWDYMGEVAKLPCVILMLMERGPGDCDGRVEVDHASGADGGTRTTKRSRCAASTTARRPATSAGRGFLPAGHWRRAGPGWKRLLPGHGPPLLLPEASEQYREPNERSDDG